MSSSEKRDLFETLYQRARPRVFSLINRSLNSADDAEDITQAAFARAWANFEWYDPARPFEAWVACIAMNLLRDDYRRRTRWRTSSLNYAGEQSDAAGARCAPELIDSRPTPEEHTLAPVISEPLLDALRGLPGMHRRCLALVGQELPYDQIAALLECPVGTVRSRVSRARAQVKHALQTSGEWAAR